MRLRAIALFAGMLVAALPATMWAQAPCSVRTITGTYAVQITGHSHIGALVPTGAPYQLRGGEAVFVARFTVARDGSVSGSLWGVYVAEPVERPFSGHATVNADCTGELVTPDETFKFVVLDNGKEVRWIPWDGFGGSVATWRRIPGWNPNSSACDQQTFSGTYAMRCEGYELTGQDSGVASSWSLFVLEAADGTMTGRMYGKQFGIPFSTQTESAFSGGYTVNSDCTVDKEFFFDAMPGVSIKARGILFEQGKQEFGVPMGVYAGEDFVAPVLPLTCVMTRMHR